MRCHHISRCGSLCWVGSRFLYTDKNVGFGFGPHICVGLGLAKAEARIAFETIFDRLKYINLDEDADLSHIPTFATRGYKKLDLVFESNS